MWAMKAHIRLNNTLYSFLSFFDIMGDPEGGQGVRTPPLKNHNILGFLSNTGPEFSENHKATKPEFNVGPSSARQ